VVLAPPNPADLYVAPPDAAQHARRFDFRTAALVLAVGLAFADASVVALALPDLYLEYHTSIVGVSWVLTIYAAVVAVAGLVLRPVTRRLGPAHTTAAGLLLFAMASLGCAAASSLPMLLTTRAVQALGAAALLEGSLEVLAIGAGGATFARRWWMAAGTFGVMLGPALGGLVTELADWRAVFVVQAPVALLAVPGAWRARGRDRHPPSLILGRASRRPPRAGLADAAFVFIFAALVGALFLGVILLVVVWGLPPVVGAAIVTSLPIGAFLGTAGARRVGATSSVLAGCMLLAAGLLTLALLPAVSTAWVFGGLLFAGAGFGALSARLGPLAVPASGDLGVAAARSSAARHLGLVLGLLVVAPLLSTGVQQAARRAELNGTATVLDSRTSGVQKVRVAWDMRSMIAQANDGAVPDLDAVFARYGNSRDVRHLQHDLAYTIKGSVTRGFRSAFAAGAALALLAAVPALMAVGWHRRRLGVAALALVILAVPAIELARGARTFGSYAAVDACAAGPDPFSGGGLDGLAQRAVLGGLNGAACELHVNREELVLSLDPKRPLAGQQWNDATVERALKAGAKRAIDDADQRNSLPGLVAGALKFAIDQAPLSRLHGWISGA